MSELQKTEVYPWPEASKFPLYFKCESKDGIQAVKVVKPGLQVYLKIHKKRSETGDLLYEYQINRIELSPMDWTYLVRWFGQSSEAEFLKVLADVGSFCIRIDRSVQNQGN